MGITEFALATIAVALGSILQAISGVGAGFLIVPLLAWIDISLVPGPVVLASISLSGTMAYHERGHIDFNFTPLILMGIIPGTIAGAWLLSRVSSDRLDVVFGSVILIAIIITVTGIRVPLSRASALIAGAISGAMGTSSGIGAPALAILYQDQSGPRVRATLAILYSIAAVFILIILTAFGNFSVSGAAAGALLIPGFLLGFVLSRRLTVRVDHGGTRIVVLGISAIAALTLLARGFWGG